MHCCDSCTTLDSLVDRHYYHLTVCSSIDHMNNGLIITDIHALSSSKEVLGVSV